MKVGFIGTGRMGEAMVRRLLDAKHDVGVYNRTAGKAKPLADAGAKILGSVADAARYGDVVYTMLADDAALEDVVFRQGLLEALPKGGIHVCAGTHGIPVIRKIKEAHADKGQLLVAAPMMGRPELVTAGTAGVFASGPAEAHGQMQAAVRRARPQAPSRAATDPEAATAMKIANNFVLGCAIEAMGEGFALTRKYGVDTSVFYDVMTDGLFNCSAYKVYGKIMVDESYCEGRPDGRAGTEGRQPRARSRPPRRACRCRAAMSGATA